MATSSQNTKTQQQQQKMTISHQKVKWENSLTAALCFSLRYGLLFHLMDFLLCQDFGCDHLL